METLPITELSDRARDIFRLVVESYLAHGQPIGSRTLSKMVAQGSPPASPASAEATASKGTSPPPRRNLSPASIRNVLQDLEELGLLAAPHVSAGRVPTESGLRLFVDGMLGSPTASREDYSHIEASLSQSQSLDGLLTQASSVLSDMSACAGLVLVPKQEQIIRQIAFVPLSAGQALAVLVAQDGSVENRVVDIPHSLSLSMLTEASNYITSTCAGLTLEAAQSHLSTQMRQAQSTIDSTAQALIERGVAVWSADANNRSVLIVRGQANLLDEVAVEDIDRVRQLLDELERKQEIAEVLDRMCRGDAMRIFIGAENKLFALSGSSVITTPYRDSEGRIVGVLGVIGPTRLNYARIIPMVDCTAQIVSRLL